VRAAAYTNKFSRFHSQCFCAQTPHAERALDVVAEYAGTLARAAALDARLLSAQRVQRTLASAVRVGVRAAKSTALPARLAGLLVAQRLLAALALAEARAAHADDTPTQRTDATADNDADDKRDADDTATYTTQGPVSVRLLPTVHDFWAVLVARLDDRLTPVVIAAVDTLAAMARAAKSFISARVGKEAWPLLLRAVATRTPLAHSAEHKLARAVFECVDALVAHCDLAPPVLRNIDAAVQRWQGVAWPDDSQQLLARVRTASAGAITAAADDATP
jgi:hypothetical protein